MKKELKRMKRRSGRVPSCPVHGGPYALCGCKP